MTFPVFEALKAETDEMQAWLAAAREALADGDDATHYGCLRLVTPHALAAIALALTVMSGTTR